MQLKASSYVLQVDCMGSSLVIVALLEGNLFKTLTNITDILSCVIHSGGVDARPSDGDEGPAQLRWDG